MYEIVFQNFLITNMKERLVSVIGKEFQIVGPRLVEII